MIFSLNELTSKKKLGKLKYSTYQVLNFIKTC